MPTRRLNKALVCSVPSVSKLALRNMRSEDVLVFHVAEQGMLPVPELHHAEAAQPDKTIHTAN
jgi:hypothetical protein